MAIAQMGTARLSIWFLKSTIHPYLGMKHFKEDYFVIETAFVVPAFVHAPDHLANWAIPEGKYPILKSKDFFTVHFDIAVLPDTVRSPDYGSACIYHQIQPQYTT